MLSGFSSQKICQFRHSQEFSPSFPFANKTVQKGLEKAWIFVSKLTSDLSLPTQFKYVRLEIRGRQAAKSAFNWYKIHMHKSGFSFWVQKNKCVAFVANCSTPASSFYGVFWRKGGEKKLALNHSQWFMDPTRYHPQETEENCFEKLEEPRAKD